jgi:DNA-binding beta-propeller fold protein YncE
MRLSSYLKASQHMRFHRSLFAALLASTLLTTGAHAKPAELSVTGKMALSDGGWDYLTFDPIHRRLYISRSDGITAIDVDSGRITAKLVDAPRTHAALPVNGGDQLVVTSTTLGGVVIADAMTGAQRTTIKTGSKPDAAFLEPTSGLVWVMDNAGGGITLIDPKLGAKVGAIEVAGNLESAANDGAGKVFVNVEDKRELVVIDAKSRKVTVHYKLEGCEEPSGLAYAPSEKRLVTVCANGSAKLVSAVNGTIIASLPIGPRGDTALFDPKRDVFYVPTAGDAKLTIISPKTAKIISVVTTQTGARTQALDPKTGALYLPAATYTASTQPGGRPTMQPGSVVLLKVGE